MELIPILSLVILVATISTFILAVGAYILYKIRERKGVVAEAPQPAAIPAELVTPAPLVIEQKMQQPGGRRTVIEEQQYQPYRESEYQQQRQSSYMTQQNMNAGPELRPTYVSPQQGPPTGERYQRSTGSDTSYGSRIVEGEKYAQKKKFMRYTNEGYVEPNQEQKKQEDNLKWR